MNDTSEIRTLDEVYKDHLIDTLRRLHGNKEQTAKALGITVKTIYNKLREYGLASEYIKPQGSYECQSPQSLD